MKSSYLKFVLGLVSLCFVGFLGLAFYTNVETGLTAEDRAVFNEMGFTEGQAEVNFETQIAKITRLQKEVFKRAPFGEGIELYEAREPADLMRVGHGLCYDRSRTFDKGLAFLGFKSRHVYLLYRQDKSFLAALITHGQSSHAITEVQTSKGWMFVDSNTPWVAVTRGGEPVAADDVWRRFSEFENPPAYLKEPWWAIRGLYSRKGHFYAPYVLFPELNWSDFLSWMVWG